MITTDILVSCYAIMFLIMNIYQLNLFYITVRYWIFKLLHGKRRFPLITDPKKLPLITIQIPTYNENPQFIDGILSSIAEQTYPKHLIQVIIVDQSTDPHIRLEMEELAERAPKAHKLDLKYTWRDRLGDGFTTSTMYKAGSLNEITGTLTKGEYILVLDADSTLNRKFLTFMIQPLIQDPNIGIVMARHVVERGNMMARWFRISYSINNLVMKMRSHLNLPHYFEGNGVLIRKSIVLQHPWDTICEDVLMSVHLYLDGWKIWFEQNGVLYNYGIPISITDLKNRWARIVYGQFASLRIIWQQRRRELADLQLLILFSTIVTLPLVLVFFPITIAFYLLNINIFNYFYIISYITIFNLIFSMLFIIVASTYYHNYSDILFAPTTTLLSIQYLIPGNVAVFRCLFGKKAAFYRTQRSKLEKVSLSKNIRVIESLFLIVSLGCIYIFQNNSEAVYFFGLYVFIMASSFIDLLPLDSVKRKMIIRESDVNEND